MKPWHKAYSGHGNGPSRVTATAASAVEEANGFLSLSRSRFTAITRTVWLVKGRECWPQQTIWQLPQLAMGELKGHVNYLMSRTSPAVCVHGELQVTKICFYLSLTFLAFFFSFFLFLLFFLYFLFFFWFCFALQQFTICLLIMCTHTHMHTLTHTSAGWRTG